jgi:hypothetical protein
VRCCGDCASDSRLLFRRRVFRGNYFLLFYGSDGLLMHFHYSSPPSLRRTNSTGSNSTSSSQGTLQQAPPSFKRFVHQTIHQVSASPACVVLGLWYISKLPLLGDVVNENERMFVEELLGSGTGGEVPWRLFVLGMTLSNKWLEDNTFTTKTWYGYLTLSPSIR